VVNVSCACQGNLRDALTGGGVEDVLQARSSWSSLDTSNAVTESREAASGLRIGRGVKSSVHDAKFKKAHELRPMSSNARDINFTDDAAASRYTPPPYLRDGCS